MLRGPKGERRPLTLIGNVVHVMRGQPLGQLGFHLPHCLGFDPTDGLFERQPLARISGSGRGGSTCAYQKPHPAQLRRPASARRLVSGRFGAMPKRRNERLAKQKSVMPVQPRRLPVPTKEFPASAKKFPDPSPGPVSAV
jgi:hypothetical protein